VIAAHGTRGLRAATPSARFSLYCSGRGADDENFIHLFAEFMAKDMGSPLGEPLKWLRDGVEFSAELALEKGLIDAVSPTPLIPTMRNAQCRSANFHDDVILP
jgi:hypothetical protein